MLCMSDGNANIDPSLLGNSSSGSSKVGESKSISKVPAELPTRSHFYRSAANEHYYKDVTSLRAKLTYESLDSLVDPFISQYKDCTSITIGNLLYIREFILPPFIQREVVLIAARNSGLDISGNSPHNIIYAVNKGGKVEYTPIREHIIDYAKELAEQGE